ncbi:MAG: hypothetical protein K0R73_743 [Candidatus Midichloriaceae bacterium]|jgi:hypothetical protein|nr:hypothetical protein [Candidatus Midichloriaceae bacterium]
MRQHNLELSNALFSEDLLINISNYLCRSDIARLSQTNTSLYLLVHQKFPHILAFGFVEKIFQKNISPIVVQIGELAHTLAYSDYIGDVLSNTYHAQISTLKQNIMFAFEYNNTLLKQLVSNKDLYIKSYEEIENKRAGGMIRC